MSGVIVSIHVGRFGVGCNASAPPTARSRLMCVCGCVAESRTHHRCDVGRRADVELHGVSGETA